MPRDSNGIYTLPTGNPVTPGTIIEADWANPTMSDMGAALSDSLSRSGLGGMLVPFKNADGTISAPGMSWSNEPTSGWYRKANNEFWYSVGNADVFQITKNGIALATGKVATNISSYIAVQSDPVTPAPPEGAQWYEDDTGALWMRYQNPDLSYVWVAVNAIGGNFLTDAPNDGLQYARQSQAWAQVADAGAVGNIVWRHGANAKHLVCNGQTVLKATYAALWTYAQGFLTVNQTNDPGLFLDVDASNFKVPNLQGLFLRGQGGASGVLGALQAEMIGPHNHFTGLNAFGSMEIAGSTLGVWYGAGSPQNTDTNAGTENRPANTALIPCIRALA
jgi:hypothetical protein